ncbi:GNAT family protein, partial [Pseudomonas aeruginosa]|uniref:GNAT family N-acetyltransferase n=1 Tax=Pseudomonas aeruginosa TaxID=287 RepID=UPI0019693328
AGCSWHLLMGLIMRLRGVYETRGDSIAISLYEKNGFKIEAIQKDKVFFMGEYYDASLYSLLLN